jgi:8-oxo-dGTP diphosphatase
MLKVVGTIFLKDNKLLIDKPRTKPTHQMIGGKVEEGETPLDAAIRECYEELGPKAIFDDTKFEPIMDFDEIATSDPNIKIHFYVFKYNGELKGELETSEEIESFLWYDTSVKEDILSNTLKHKVIPYCIENNLIK